MRFGLEDSVVEKISSIFAKYPQVETAILYGSRAKSNYKKGSDIDLVLKGYDLNLSLLHNIELELDDLLMPYTFDISIFNHISNHELLEHINRVGVAFYDVKKGSN